MQVYKDDITCHCRPIPGIHFVPVDRADGRSGAADALKSSARASPSQDPSMSAGSANPLGAFSYYASSPFFWLMLTIDQWGWRHCFPVAREGTEAQGGGSDVGAGILTLL